jgi:ABC-type multidrug transport system ATPase subunit
MNATLQVRWAHEELPVGHRPASACDAAFKTAAALLGDLQVIVLHEPTTGLDVRGVAWLRRQVREWADVGRTVLVASHSLTELAAMVDWLLVLDRGRLVREVARDELDHGVDLQTALFELLTARQPSRARRLLTGRVPFAALRL